MTEIGSLEVGRMEGDTYIIAPTGTDPDAPLRDEDYDVGPGGCGVSFVTAGELPGEEPETSRCPGIATRTLYGVTVCEACYERETADAA